MKLSSFSLLLVLGGLVASCSAPPAPASLTLHFEHGAPERDLLLSEPFSTPYGVTLWYDHLAYRVSEVRLLKGASEVVIGEGPYPVVLGPGTGRVSVTLPTEAVGAWDGIVLHLGGDEQRSAVAGGGGTLASRWFPETGPALFSAAGEFISEKTEGAFSVKVVNEVHFKRLTARVKVPLQVVRGASTEVRVKVQVGRLFAGVDLSKTPVIEPSAELDSPAGKVAGNWSRLFWLESGGERVHMTSTRLQRSEDDERASRWDTTPPALTEPTVNLEAALEHCGRVGATPCIIPFRGEGREPGILRIQTAPNAAVVAAGPGIVEEVRFVEHSHLTHSDLFNVRVRPKRDSVFVVEYGNLKGVKVSRGDRVRAGEQLGRAGDGGDVERGEVSFGIGREQNLNQRLCPEPFMTDELRLKWEAAFSAQEEEGSELGYSPMCEVQALACVDVTCEDASSFVEAQGDADAGRAVYLGACAGCHGGRGEGGIASALRTGREGTCGTCGAHVTLAKRIEEDMPPEGYCDPRCAADVAAFILWEFGGP